ncbi:hypothetical protein [Lactobacillus sp. UMNPBX17]|nr:hypothetical protein [Lactobacillus sp. UMNPBX17]
MGEIVKILAFESDYFRIFPNVVAFLTVPNPAQLFELHVLEQI